MLEVLSYDKDDDGYFRDSPYHIEEDCLWAIVKDLEPWHEPPPRHSFTHDMEAHFTKELIGMVRGLRKLHQVGIWVGDIHASNYRQGRLIDFSYAVTMPHPYLKRKIMDDENKVPEEEHLVIDAYQMDIIVDWWNAKHPRDADKIWERVMPNSEYRHKTRFGIQHYPRDDQYPHRPEEYDWKAAERERKEKEQEKKRNANHDKKGQNKRGGAQKAKAKVKSGEVSVEPGMKRGKRGRRRAAATKSRSRRVVD